MKSTPILFSRAMVQAILGDRKSQTRRIVRLHQMLQDALTPKAFSYLSCDGGWVFDSGEGLYQDGIKCPYGQPSDQLWVREEHYRFGHWEPVTGLKSLTRHGRQRWKFVADSSDVLFDAPAEFRKGMHSKDPETPAWHKRLARFMPKAFSRITLEIVNVRVERLQDISEEDAKAEGAERAYLDLGGLVYAFPNRGNNAVSFTGELPKTSFHAAQALPKGTYVCGYRYLWKSINGPGSWDENPFVWVVTFKRL